MTQRIFVFILFGAIAIGYFTVTRRHQQEQSESTKNWQQEEGAKKAANDVLGSATFTIENKKPGSVIYDRPETYDMRVTHVDADGAAEHFGLRVDDVISGYNHDTLLMALIHGKPIDVARSGLIVTLPKPGNALPSVPEEPRSSHHVPAG